MICLQELDQQNGCQWSDLFQLPEREGMVGESSCFEDNKAYAQLFCFGSVVLWLEELSAVVVVM